MTITEIRDQIHQWVDKGDAKVLKMLYAICKVYFTDTNGGKVVAAQDDLYRMVYTSARSRHCDEKQIEDILQKSRKNNPEHDLTGLLLHTDDRFIQILEGPLQSIMDTYSKIARDTRHGGSQIRFFEKVSERHFTNWHMGSKEINLIKVKGTGEVSEKERATYQSLADGDLMSYQDQGMRVLKTFLAIS